MKGQDIINKLNQRSTNPAVRFKEIIRKIFPQVAKDEKRSFSFNAVISNSISFDFLLPYGIKNYKKPIYVEIKYFLKKSIPQILSSIKSQFAPYKQHLYYTGSSLIDLNYILYILPFQLNENEKLQIIEEFKLYINRYEIIIWDINDLKPYFQDYAEYIIDIVPELEEQAVKNIVDKSTERSSEDIIDPEFQINKIRNSYKQDDLVLFLGAGVSVVAGLPTWDGLLSKLLIAIIENKTEININLEDEQKEKLAENLKRINGNSPLQVTRYISSGLKDNFEKKVSETLYKTSKNVSEVSLLNAIGKLCIPPRSGNGIRAIANYNFDDIIESVLNGFEIKNRPIYNDNSFPTNQEIGIYHVHGFLPRNPENFEGLRDSLLIFSEKNYHTIMSDPYNWSNLTQLNFFRENTCLFIGQSGTDPNLRRLLEIAKQRTKISKHFIFLKRTPKKEFIKGFEINLPDDKSINTLIEVHHTLQELSFDEIGLNVLWVNEYSEIEEYLNKIKNY